VGPLVSIVINNYNYGRFVADAIDSALEQTYSNREVIVVDDGSQDNSRDVISSFGNRVKAVFKSNGGQSSAFNAGFAESSGDVICFLDSDDVFLPTKVQRVVDGLATGPLGWCFHHVQWSDTSLRPMFTPPIPYSTGRYDFRSELLEGKCTFAPPATSGLAFTRNLLNRLMPIPEIITITSDNYLKLSSLALEPGYFIAEQYALQRMHGENLYTGGYVLGRKAGDCCQDRLQGGSAKRELSRQDAAMIVGFGPRVAASPQRRIQKAASISYLVRSTRR
jgi:glycosyltransferase involved in cell wall biosynthesis